MAFTEAQLNTAIDPNGTGRIVTITRMSNGGGTANTDVNVQGVTAPYAGKSAWVQIANTNNAAQAWALIQAALA